MSKHDVDSGEADGEALERETLLLALREVEATLARTRQDAERLRAAEERKLLGELLPVLDNLQRTVDAARTWSDPSLVEGMQMVQGELQAVLVRHGVERVEAVGQRFDPAIHEAVAAVPVLDPALVGSVVQQAAPGYRLGGKVLRAAKVKVGVASPAAPAARPRAVPLGVPAGWGQVRPRAGLGRRG